jgi:predicted nucleic acid-binding protein
MPISHLLDTSVYCQPLKPQPLPAVELRWRALGDSALATSIICEAELLYGMEWKKSGRLRDLYDQLLKDRMPVFPVDTAVAKAFSVIKAACRKKGASASDFDFLIAATAKARGLILATLNVRHFQIIEGLAIENWSS